MQDREDLIQQIGRKEFNRNPNYEYLRDKTLPPCFLFIFNSFMELYNAVGEDGITWRDIESYCNMRDITFRQIELDYIWKLKSWADQETSRLRDENE